MLKGRSVASVAAVELGGVRTFLGYANAEENELIGILFLNRQFVRRFTDKQIDFVKNFAALSRHSHRERTAAQRTAAFAGAANRNFCEVLGVISRSRFELQPVLQSVVDTAARLCRAKTSGIFRLEGGGYRLAAVSGLFDPPAYLEHEQQALISPGPGTIVGRAAMDRQVVQIEDAWSDPLYEEKESANWVAFAR